MGRLVAQPVRIALGVGTLALTCGLRPESERTIEAVLLHEPASESEVIRVHATRFSVLTPVDVDGDGADELFVVDDPLGEDPLLGVLRDGEMHELLRTPDPVGLVRWVVAEDGASAQLLAYSAGFGTGALSIAVCSTASAPRCTETAALALEGGTSDFFLHDLDDDEALDLITNVDATVLLRRATSDDPASPAWAAPEEISTGHHLAVGDVDDDGNIDIVALDGNDALVIRFGADDGSFPPTWFERPSDGWVETVALAAAAGNAGLDVFVLGDGVLQLANRGGRTFEHVSPLGTDTPSATAVLFGEFAHAQGPELLLVDDGGATRIGLVDPATGTWALRELATPRFDVGWRLFAADLDGNGLDDLVSESSHYVGCWRSC